MIKPDLEMIWAQSTDQRPIIGLDGKLPWHLPEDLQYFQAKTANQVVIMGRKTWQSLPKRPLANRTNVVITSSSNQSAFPGAEISSYLPDVIRRHSGGGRRLMVIGGQQLFAAAMPHASRLWVTEVDLVVSSLGQQPVYAPPIDQRLWQVDTVTGWRLSLATGILYRFLSYRRA